MQQFINEFIRQFNATFIEKDGWKALLAGLGNTLVLTIGATILGCIIGVLVAIVKVYHTQTKKHKWLDFICDVYLTVIRGTPIVVQLLIMNFLIFAAFDGALLVALLALGINSGAYVAEIIRSGIMAIDIGQTEAGRSLGLSSGTTMRLIVLPQAIKNILPALGNEFIALLKETSVVGYIAVSDLTRAATNIRARTAMPFFSLIATALVYLLLVMGITKLFRTMEGRMRKSDRG